MEEYKEENIILSDTSCRYNKSNNQRASTARKDFIAHLQFTRLKRERARVIVYGAAE